MNKESFKDRKESTVYYGFNSFPKTRFSFRSSAGPFILDISTSVSTLIFRSLSRPVTESLGNLLCYTEDSSNSHNKDSSESLSGSGFDEYSFS